MHLTFHSPMPRSVPEYGMNGVGAGWAPNRVIPLDVRTSTSLCTYSTIDFYYSAQSIMSIPRVRHLNLEKAVDNEDANYLGILRPQEGI
jgi:hypothetical protein